MKISNNLHSELADDAKQYFESEFHTHSQNVTARTYNDCGKLLASVSGGHGIHHAITFPNGRIKIKLAKNIIDKGWRGYEILISDGKYEEINHLVRKRVFINFSLRYNGWINKKHDYTVNASVTEFPKATMETQQRVITPAAPATPKTNRHPTSKATKNSSTGDWILISLCLIGCGFFLIGG